ncbi:MAG TPA: hypothetical protein VJW20_00735 [Candidatus Angelobacter sp.]|nr:hypothetical protein [Candidatus Angelobacter sp.]
MTQRMAAPPISGKSFHQPNLRSHGVSGQNAVDVIDGNTIPIVNRPPLEPNPSDGAIDLVHHLLYISSPNFSSAGGNVVTAIDTRP